MKKERHTIKCHECGKEIVNPHWSQKYCCVNCFDAHLHRYQKTYGQKRWSKIRQLIDEARRKENENAD